MMRKSRCTEAESIHKLIRTEIIKSNTSSFENISSRSCAKEMWTKVRELTGKGRVSQSQAGIQGLNISAEQLNLHYTKISTDINYEHSSLKSSVYCSDSCSLISDYSVFKYLILLNLQHPVLTKFLTGSSKSPPIVYTSPLPICTIYLLHWELYPFSGKLQQLNQSLKYRHHKPAQTSDQYP